MKRAIAIVMFLSCFYLPAHAQVSGGAVAGTVAGENGAAIPDVRILLQDVATGLARTGTTNASGIYSLADVPPDNYEMTVSAQGFTTQLWTGITVIAGVQRNLNVVIHPGDPNQVARVAAPAAQVSEACLAVC
jgi:hypothetical protein